MTFIYENKPLGISGNRIANDAKASINSLYATEKTGEKASSFSNVCPNPAVPLAAFVNHTESLRDGTYTSKPKHEDFGTMTSLVRIPFMAKAHNDNNIGDMTLHSRVAGHLVGRA